MQKHIANTVPTIEAALTGRQFDVFGNEYYAVAWPTSENCIGLPSDLVNFDGYKQSNSPNRM